MPSNLELLQARKTAIFTELAAGPAKPSYTIDGQNVDWNGYRKGLMDELKMINEEINIADGPWSDCVLGLGGP